MRITKKLIKLSIVVAMASTATMAQAALEQQRQQMIVEANIPTNDFSVEPVGSDWTNIPQIMSYNTASKSLTPIRKQLHIKSVAKVQGYLETPAAITGGGKSIDLNVSVNGIAVNTTAADVLTAAEALPGKNVDFEVAAVKPAAGFLPGDYQGIVQMMFESTIP